MGFGTEATLQLLLGVGWQGMLVTRGLPPTSGFTWVSVFCDTPLCCYPSLPFQEKVHSKHPCLLFPQASQILPPQATVSPAPGHSDPSTNALRHLRRTPVYLGPNATCRHLASWALPPLPAVATAPPAQPGPVRRGMPRRDWRRRPRCALRRRGGGSAAAAAEAAKAVAKAAAAAAAGPAGGRAKRRGGGRGARGGRGACGGLRAWPQ